MTKSPAKTIAAFTLIELSIVLVIIGLIVGGVLVGQDLIRAAEDRKILSYREQLLAAVNTFRLKYNGLPGDLNNAEDFWGSDASCPNTPTNTVPKVATCNGDGDKQVDGYYTPSSSNCSSAQQLRESHRFWQQLANAGLIAGQYTGVPAASTFYQTIDLTSPNLGFNESIGISTMGAMNCTRNGAGLWAGTAYFHTIFYIGTQDTISNAPFIQPIRVQGIDTKIDDGKPGEGIIMVYSPSLASNALCASSNTASSATYLVTQTGKNCTILLNEKF